MTRALREALAARGVGGRDGFRWRGGEISRLEGLRDAVFAFAVTLLVVSLEVPRTFTELTEVMRGFLAFAVCFTLLIVIVGLAGFVYFLFGPVLGVHGTITGKRRGALKRPPS